MISKLRLSILAVTLLVLASFGSQGCVKNPDTGELEPDYPKIAEVTQLSAQNLSSGTLKWLYKEHPEYVEPVYKDFIAIIGIMQSYGDGTVAIGETIQNAIDVFNRVQARISSVGDNIIVELVTSTISSLVGALNIVLTAVDGNAALVLTGLALGAQGGLEDFNAWVATQIAPVGVNP